MRKTGISTGQYIRSWDADFNEVFARLRLHGFDSIDIGLAVTEPSPVNIYQRTGKDFEQTLERVRDAAREQGVEIYQAHGPWRHPPKDATEEDRAEWREYMERGIYGCYILGCKYFVIHPIMPYGTGAEPDSKMFYKLNYEFFKSLIPTAEKYGVIICVENMPFKAHSLARPKEIADFVKDLDSKNVASCLDTGHAQVLGFTAAEAVEIMKDSLVALHVHDNDGVNDLHQFPFDGVTDWQAFAEAIKGIDEKVVMSVETSASHTLPDWDEKQKELCARAKKLIV